MIQIDTKKNNDVWDSFRLYENATITGSEETEEVTLPSTKRQRDTEPFFTPPQKFTLETHSLNTKGNLQESP